MSALENNENLRTYIHTSDDIRGLFSSNNYVGVCQESVTNPEQWDWSIKQECSCSFFYQLPKCKRCQEIAVGQMLFEGKEEWECYDEDAYIGVMCLHALDCFVLTQYNDYDFDSDENDYYGNY